MTINVIDLFAGPGGLGEGFSAFRDNEGDYPFKIHMSVENEASAHRTLMLRAFIRKFRNHGIPLDYHRYRAGEISLDKLYDSYPAAKAEALKEVMEEPTALGKDNDRIHARLHELKRSVGEDAPWIVIGGPPCQAYSLAGRSRNKGIADYRPEDDHRNFLYRQYLEVLARVHPDIFVMENVKGMLSAKPEGRPIFDEIFADLQRPGMVTGVKGAEHLRYRIRSLVMPAMFDEMPLEPRDYLIRAEKFGVPQARHRVILLGIREDIAAGVGSLHEANHSVTVEQMIGSMPKLRSRISRGGDDPDRWIGSIREGVNRIARHGSTVLSDDFVETLKEQSERLTDLPLAARYYLDGATSLGSDTPSALSNWILGDSGGVLTHHEARGHMSEDLVRYFFAATWSRMSRGVSPRSKDYPGCLAPFHASWKSGNFADRFRVQGHCGPSTTITSHISKDGHYYIHPDPLQCRSLTVREAARLQTFPDNYFFEGNRTQQYVQVGNAVPPYLARQIADVVHQILN